MIPFIDHVTGHATGLVTGLVTGHVTGLEVQQRAR